MKRKTLISFVSTLCILVVVACGPGPAPKAGTASPNDMLAMIPHDVSGLVFIDMNKAMSTSMAKDAIKKAAEDEDFQTFIEATGFDLEKDLHYLALGLTGKLYSKKMEAVAVINMKYDKGKILDAMKQKAQEEGEEGEENKGSLIEKDYEGLTMYKWEKDEENNYFVFYDESNALFGDEASVMSSIDVILKKKDSVLKNEELTALIGRTNKDALLWGAILLPQEVMEEATAGNPMVSGLSAIRSLALFFDYKNANLMADILLMSDDATKNKQIADSLTGLKGLGGLFAGENPEIADLIGRIEITSGDDNVRISASIPESLINTITEKEKAKAEEKEKEGEIKE